MGNHAAHDRVGQVAQGLPQHLARRAASLDGAAGRGHGLGQAAHAFGVAGDGAPAGHRDAVFSAQARQHPAVPYQVGGDIGEQRQIAQVGAGDHVGGALHVSQQRHRGERLERHRRHPPAPQPRLPVGRSGGGQLGRGNGPPSGGRQQQVEGDRRPSAGERLVRGARQIAHRERVCSVPAPPFLGVFGPQAQRTAVPDGVGDEHRRALRFTTVTAGLKS